MSRVTEWEPSPFAVWVVVDRPVRMGNRTKYMVQRIVLTQTGVRVTHHMLADTRKAAEKHQRRFIEMEMGEPARHASLYEQLAGDPKAEANAKSWEDAK